MITHRRFVNAAVDSVAWVLAMFLALLFRHDFLVPGADVKGLLVLLPVALVLQFLVGVTDGVYVGRWTLGSFEELAALTRTVALTALVLLLVNLATQLVPNSVVLGGPVVALVAMVAAGGAWRLRYERQQRPSVEAQPLLVYGAGEAGAQVITSLMRNPKSLYRPVGIIDDAAAKANLRVRGVPVLGTKANLSRLIEVTGATTLLLAIAGADAALVREVSALCLRHDLDFRVVPSTTELLTGRLDASDIRPVTEADLLGRREIRTDLVLIDHYLAGKRVLVTGGGGSIGSELCRQLKHVGADRLLMLDRDESALHALQLSMEGRALLDNGDLLLCDIRDENRLREVFDEHRPQVVFHAAALKHLSLLERYPAEALKTNVQATQRLLELAVEYGVERFVNISTDKAADPSSVLGASKRITERLTANAATRAEGLYLSVRFGNVLGSRGSVLPLFREQIQAGGPVTVTHRKVTRFFMTIPEAVQLVIQAGALGAGGDVLVLDMGEPVEIDEVARRLIAQSGKSISIEYTGLRPGEKLHEVLLGPDEVVHAKIHPLISHVTVAPVLPAAVKNLQQVTDAGELAAAMAEVANSPAHGHTPPLRPRCRPLVLPQPPEQIDARCAGPFSKTFGL